MDLKSLPPWNYEEWTTTEPKQTNSLKERLLLGSLDLIKAEPDNEEACREIVEQALEAGLFDIAFEAVRTFSKKSRYDFFASITDIFEEMSYWKHCSGEFVDYCEQRVLQLSVGDDYYDQRARSRSLGYLGRYRFFTGRAESAISLWDSADDRETVDEVIAEMCETIAERSPQYLEASLALIDLIKINTIKAKTMATLSQYA